MRKKILPKKKKKRFKIGLPKHNGGVVYVSKKGTPRCYMCGKKIESIIKLKEMKENGDDYMDAYSALQARINNTIVTLPKQDGTVHPLYRHNDARCEPGESND